jgi:tetratricopeptide (TPR) repeat protein
MPDRIEEFQKFIEQFPDQAFPRYALAMELKGQGRLEESRRAFQALVAKQPSYVPVYLQLGFVLTEMGLREEARDIFRKGIDAARNAGDGHALSELTASLQALETAP